MSSTASGLPSWMMLDRFVFRRDDDDGSFPDEDAAPMRASSFTSLGDPFTVALLPAEPPAVSRLYEQWLAQNDSAGTDLITAHRGLLLFRALSQTTEVSRMPYRQDFFVFKAATAAGVDLQLKRLPDPECIEPLVVHKGRRRRELALDRWFHLETIGLVSGGRGGDDDEFAVVQLAKFVDIPVPGSSTQNTEDELYAFDSSYLSCRVASGCKLGAELCLFRSRLSSSSSSKSSDDDDCVVAEGNWEILTLLIQYHEEELSDLMGWSTDGAITFNDSICWFDYHQGGIMSYTPPPLGEAVGGGQSFISYVRLPIDNRPNSKSGNNLEMYRSLSVTGQRGNEQLKFVDVARNDSEFYGPLWNGYSFTITCYTFTPADDQMWHKDVVITSKELWHLDDRTCLLQRNAVTTFPLVSRDKPHLIHFKMKGHRQGQGIDKVSVVVIDIITKTVVSVFPYIQGGEDLLGKDADMVKFNSCFPGPFLPTMF